MKKYYLTEGNFHINNICNFNCENCNRFSNYAFSGHYHWHDYKEIYKKWSEVISFGRWVVLGGEPTINKDYVDWLRGLHELWPDVQGELLTNGSLLKSTDTELYEFLKSANGKVHISIGLHNLDRRKEIIDFCLAFLKYPYPWGKDNFNKIFIDSYNQIKDVLWPDLNHFSEWHNLPEHIKTETETVFSLSPNLYLKKITDEIKNSSQGSFVFEDENNVKIYVRDEDLFFKHAVILDSSKNYFELHNNDKHKAHDACIVHRGECTEFIKGKLYKCSVSGLLPEFDQQFIVNATPEDRKIIYSYKPGSITDPPEELDQWFENQKNPIDMCKFCTVDYSEQQIFAGKKKIFIKKKIIIKPASLF
jgi:organic radical activating enzyme